MAHTNDCTNLKNFLLNKKILSIESVYNDLSSMLQDAFKKNLSIFFKCKYLYFEYINQYNIKTVSITEEINIFEFKEFEGYSIFMVPHNFFSICTYVFFGDLKLISYFNNACFLEKKNNTVIIDIIFNTIFMALNNFFKKFFFISINRIFKNKNSIKKFFKNEDLNEYIFFLFQMIYGNIKEVIKMCIPKKILYQISLNNFTQSNFFKKNILKAWNQKIQQNIISMNFFLKVNIISYSISLKHFLTLRVGDIFHIKSVKYVFGFIHEIPFLLGKYGINNGYRALYFKHFINRQDKNMVYKDPIMSRKDDDSFLDTKIHQHQNSDLFNKENVLDQEKTLQNASNLNRNSVDFIKTIKPFMDIPVAITIELGTKKLSLKKLLKLSEGSILQLEETDNVPLKIYINNYLLALGELVVINETYGIRIIKLLENKII